MESFRVWLRFTRVDRSILVEGKEERNFFHRLRDHLHPQKNKIEKSELKKRSTIKKGIIEEVLVHKEW